MVRAADAVAPPRAADRWVVLLAAALLMACGGITYSWSLFARPLSAFFGWSSLQVSLVFGVLVAAIGIGSLVGGLLHDRLGPHRVALIGAAVFGAGQLVAGLGLARFGLTWLYLTYGVIGGFGCGMLYVTPGACVTKWFPDARGFANGVTLLGFGSGAIVYNQILNAFPNFRAVSDDAMRAVQAVHRGLGHVHPRWDIGVIATTFVWTGVGLLVLGCSLAMILRAPPEGYAAGRGAGGPRVRDVTLREVLRLPQFYLLWTMILFDATAGLGLFSNAVPLYVELTGVSASTAAVAFGYLSFFNGLGRLLWGWLSDYVGRHLALVLAFLCEAFGFIAIGHLREQVGVDIAFAAIFLAFGGALATIPPLAADYFGTKYLGSIYGALLTAASVAGLVGPTVVGQVEDVTGSLIGAMAPIGILCLCGAAVPFFTRKPKALAAQAVA